MNAMNAEISDQISPADWETRPKTPVVIGLLIGAALIISYLIAYCLMNALVASDVIARWKPDHDPRPRYFICAFMSLLGVFAMIAFVARTMSRRHLSKIDAMEIDETE